MKEKKYARLGLPWAHMYRKEILIRKIFYIILQHTYKQFEMIDKPQKLP